MYATVTVTWNDQTHTISVPIESLDEYDEVVSDLTKFLLDN